MKTATGDELIIIKDLSGVKLGVKLSGTITYYYFTPNEIDHKISRILTRTCREEKEGIFEQYGRVYCHPEEIGLIGSSLCPGHEVSVNVGELGTGLSNSMTKEQAEAWLKLIIDRINSILNQLYILPEGDYTDTNIKQDTWEVF